MTINLTGERIGPTAHYTGYVWARNGLSHPGLETTEGRILFDSLQPAMLISRAVGGPTLEAYLLARHRGIDALLERAITQDGVTQVIEVAAGLSPRGWRFTQRYGERLRYIEADLPDMAARKRQALEQMRSLSERHEVRELDALRDDGPDSLASLAAELDRHQGLAIVTEGLLGYLPTDAVKGIWRRSAAVLADFPVGRYIADVHMGNLQTVPVRAFRLLLSAFVRGGVYLHFADAARAVQAAQSAGFASAHVQRAADVAGAPGDPGNRMAHILEASTT